jgi:undecaprenyl-diphosphatase
MTLLLVMLHTGTMFAVIVYFWRQWRAIYFQNVETFKAFAVRVILATLITGVIGEVIKKIIEVTVLSGVKGAEIEDLFGHLEFIAPALAAAGLIIIWAGIAQGRKDARPVDLQAQPPDAADANELTLRRAGVIGLMQGLCLPFRGLSRSGTTISTGMLLGLAKARAEAFSFALAVVITPPVVGREVIRLVKMEHANPGGDLGAVALGSVLGAAIAFIAGLLALKWLSQWLEKGRWALFGIYCLFAAGVVAALHHAGY